MRLRMARRLNTAVSARCLSVLFLALLTACSLPEPPVPTTPRPTAPTILQITPAATQDIDATATSYAQLLIPTPTASGLYVVQAGDTLSALAADFGTTVDEIMAANGLTDANAIQVGQTLIIPSLVQSSPAFEQTPVVTVVVSGTAELSSTATLTASTELTPTLDVTAIPTLSTP